MVFALPNRWSRCAFVVLLPLAAVAAPVQPVDEAVLGLDRTIQALKGEVLDLNQRALSTEEAFLYPEETRVTVYVGVKAQGLLVENVTITVDDNTPTRREFEMVEAITLQSKGLYQALRLNAAPGAHRIRAEFSARYADSKPGSPSYQGRYEAVFEKTAQPSDLEVLVAVETIGKAPIVRVRDWRAAR